MLSRKEVEHIAYLSRIRLSDSEIARLTKELDSILEYINKLAALNVDTVEPTSHVLPIQNIFREDSVQPSLPQEDAMKIAISSTNGSFTVPQVIE